MQNNIQNKGKSNASGSTLLFIIIALVAVAALAAGMQQMSTDTTYNELMFNQANKSRYLAEAGELYARTLAASYKAQKNTLTTYVTAVTSAINNTDVFGAGNGTFTIATAPGYTSGSPVQLLITGTTNSGFFSNYRKSSTTSVGYSFASNNMIYAPGASVTFNKDTVVEGDLTVGALSIAKDNEIIGNIYSSAGITRTGNGGDQLTAKIICAKGDVVLPENSILDIGAIYTTPENCTNCNNDTDTCTRKYTGKTVKCYIDETNRTVIGHNSSPICEKGSDPYIAPISATYTAWPTATTSGVNAGSIVVSNENNYFTLPDFPKDTKLCLDLRYHNVNIFVNNNIIIDKDFEEEIIPPGSTDGQCISVDLYFEDPGRQYAAKVYFQTTGSFYLSKSDNESVYWFGTVYAAGGITIKKNVASTTTPSLIGSFAVPSTATFSVDKDINMYYVPSEYAAENW